MCFSVSFSRSGWGEVRQTKIKKIKAPVLTKNEKSTLKITRIGQISQFCNKLIYFLT